MNTERLNKMADFLDELPPEKFDFSVPIKEMENDCGSVCCAIGWIPSVFPKLAKWDGEWVELLSGNTTGYAEQGAEIFDIPLTDASTLFSPNFNGPPGTIYRRAPGTYDKYLMYSYGIHALPIHATPKELADNIRRYIAFHTPEETKELEQINQNFTQKIEVFIDRELTKLENKDEPETKTKTVRQEVQRTEQRETTAMAERLRQS